MDAAAQFPSHLSYRRTWRAVQLAVWLVGVTIVALLIFAPTIGIHAFWNVLIPIAPALLAFAPGLWRNICPLASSALFLRHMGSGAKRKVTHAWQGIFLLIGVFLLYAIVPLRHVVMDLNGPATALAILSLAALAVVMVSQFEWKSGWCSGMCPVHPVERLYGSSPLVTPPNAHCTTCERCVQPCADATENLDPMTSGSSVFRRLTGLLMIGGFPGFIWGWFQVRDYAGAEGWRHLTEAYAWPFGAAAITLALYMALEKSGRIERRLLRRTFAAAAIACYYWFRLPALFGFGPFPGDGMLVDATGVLPAWFPLVSQITTTALFAWWLIGRRALRRSWAKRPPYADDADRMISACSTD